MKNIHLIRARESRLYYTISMSGYNLKLSERPISKSSEVRPQNIYITSDEEIKPNTYCLINGVLCKTEIREGKIVSRQLTGGGTMDICKSEYLEIILTTDDRLIADGVQAIDDDFLEWFVKNPSCEEIEVEEEDYSQKCRECGEVVKRGYCCNKGCFMKSGNFIPTDENSKYKIIIPKEEPKTAWVGVLHDKLNEYYPAEYELKDIYQGKGCLPNFPNEELCQIWCDSKYKEEPNYNMKQEIIDEMKKQEEPKQETLEEALKFPLIIENGMDYLNLTTKIFNNGAKYMAERMYSEEEVKDLIEDWTKMASGLNQNFPLDKFNIWFEQFKK